MANVIIRAETPNDYQAIREINIAAFANQPYSQQTEHLIVEALRADGALTLSLVAETERGMVGHIAFSPVTIDGKDLQWFALGPVAVLPSMQKQGTGSALVKAGLRSLRASGARSCVLVGDPAFYGRFGFRHYPMIMVEDIPPEFVLALPWTDDVPHGKIEHHRAFRVRSK